MSNKRTDRREARRLEAEERQTRYDSTPQIRHFRQGRKARDGELDPTLYTTDEFGRAARKPVAR